MKAICIWLIRLYRRYLSPLKSRPTCRFDPTCSAYAIEAFTKRGFFAGMILTVWRILRCNPFCAPGYDPVPDIGFGTHGKGVLSDNDEDQFDSGELPKQICQDYMERRPWRQVRGDDEKNERSGD